MFLRKAALRPVPRWATVTDLSIDQLEDELGDSEAELQESLDAGYRTMDRLQPALAGWLAHELSSPPDELAQSVGYFLGVTVFLAFREAFPTRLEPVDEAGLRLALDTLDVDAELRANDPTEVLESDDVVAMGQPALVSYAQHHFDEALSQAGSDADLDSFDAVYRCILVEIIALSHCVKAPTGRAPRPFA